MMSFSVMLMVKSVILLMSVLLGIAFVTYCERKLLGYIQLRKGPNKVGYKGLLQPFSDGVKLFCKEVIMLSMSNYWMYLWSPLIMLSLMLLIWISIPSSLGMMEMKLGIVYLLCCLGLGVYPVLMGGWFSNSKYPIMGSLRVVAQTISYEVSMVLIMLSFVVLVGSYSLDDYLDTKYWGLFMSPFLGVIWFISLLVELNRTPFDLSEGESELVSGFNTEYSGGLFVLFFLAEYGMIIFLSMLFSVMLLGGGDLSGLLFVKVINMVVLVIWVRGVLPRMRYDKLMMLTWKIFLPCALMYFMFFTSLVVFMNMV
uniref:NADH dehydrogenase subunit 1 n=1 Tax=Ichthyoxenos japonensis TaxID=2033261 RepID=UPI000EF2C8A3|nr:NADH dehydrogenase subunit 1 [Ichthyoxenos japonensis]ATO58526.1 NADH dehydrogenase subunit 1 [Ichthyoxenos japonensis]